MATNIEDLSGVPEPHSGGGGHLREIVLGAQDNLTNTLGVVLGVAIGSSDLHAVALAGLAAGITQSFSMGAVVYTSTRAERDLYFHALEIEKRMPPGLLKRRPGYALDRCAREPNNLTHLLCGSEGTLAAITSAELKIVPLWQKSQPSRRKAGSSGFPCMPRYRKRSSAHSRPAVVS